MKSKNTILTALYHEAVSYFTTITGSVYKQTRPTNSTAEDCIISIIEGGVDKFTQYGRVFIKIYYADLFINDTYEEDLNRGSVLQTQMFEFSEYILTRNIQVAIQVNSRRVSTVPMPPDTTKEHYVLLTFDYLY